MASVIIGGLTAIGVPAGLAGVLGAGLVRLAFAAVLYFAAVKSQPKQAERNRELQVPTGKPPKRYVYGYTRVYGSYAPVKVKGKILYACLILNSRPSEGEFSILIDKRKIALTGNPYDFSTDGGAKPTDPPETEDSGFSSLGQLNPIKTPEFSKNSKDLKGKMKAWIGLGDQTSPPQQILDEVPEFFISTDGWLGQTVLWLRLDAGDEEDRRKRWPRVPPEVEVEGKFSKVYDPRKSGHDFNDPQTWEFSQNQALCLMDALTQNPVEPYPINNILIDNFLQAANIADQVIALADGNAESRYRVGGFIRFDDTEIEDQVEPLVNAGGGSLMRVGGKLGYVAGAYSEPVYELNDMLGDSFEFVAMGRGRDLPTQIRCSYISASRNYEEAELEPWDIPGAQVEDGGIPKVRDLTLNMVHSPTQAMRLRKIYGMNLRLQRKLKCQAPPDAFDLIGGSGVTVSLPQPYARMNGHYRVEKTNPAFDFIGETGVAMRCPITLGQHSALPYDWSPSEEEEIIEEDFSADRIGLQAINQILATSNDVLGGIDFFSFAFEPINSTVFSHYEYQFRERGGSWQNGGEIDKDLRNADGLVYGAFPIPNKNKTYDVRVRSVSFLGSLFSEWQYLENLNFTFKLSGVTANAAPGRVEFAGTTPVNESFAGVRIYRSDNSIYEESTALTPAISLPQSSAFSVYAGDINAFDHVTDGDFDVPSSWVNGSGWTVANGTANHIGAAGNLSQPIGTVSDNLLRYSVLANYISGSLMRVKIDGDTEKFGSYHGGSGWKIGNVSIPSNPISLAIVAGTNSEIEIETLKIVEGGVEMVKHGQGFFWIVPVSSDGSEGSPAGPFNLQVP